MKCEVTFFLLAVQISWISGKIQGLNYIIHLDNLNHTAIDTLTDSFLPKKPPVNFYLLQNQLIELKNDVKKNNLNRLDVTVEVLNELVTNHGKEQTELMDTFRETLRDFITEIIHLRQQLDDKQKKNVMKIEERKQEMLPIETLIEMKNRKFKEASDKLYLMTNPQKNDIVNALYGSQDSNFDLLLGFCSNIDDPRESTVLYKFLYDAMKTNGADASKFLKLIDGIQRSSGSDQSEAQTLVEEAKQDLGEATETIITEQVLFGCKKNEKLTLTTNKIYDFDKNFFSKVIYNVVGVAYDRIDTVDLITRIDSFLPIPQKVLAFDYLYDNMKVRTTTRTRVQSTIKLATTLLNLKKEINVMYGANPFDELNDLIEKLPKCVRNAVFSNAVRIWSGRFKESLYAATPAFNYNDENRRLFTWIPKYVSDDTQHRFVFEPTPDNYFRIRSINYNEYVYALNTTYDTERRMIYTWTKGGYEELNGTELWKLEPDGDNCFIKNLFFDEYMYSPAVINHDKDRRPIAAWIPRSRFQTFAWTINDSSS